MNVNINSYHLLNAFYLAPCPVLCLDYLIQSPQQGKCIIILTFQMRKLRLGKVKSFARGVTCTQWSLQRPEQGSGYLIPASVWIITFLSLSWAKSQKGGVWSAETTVTGGLLCVQRLLQTHVLSQLLLTHTLQGPCHCPLLIGKKTRGQRASQMSLPFWPL